MTLILSAKCELGIVVAADSVSTGPRTRKEVEKLVIHADEVVMGISGNPSVGMRIMNEIRGFRQDSSKRDRDPLVMAPQLRKRVWDSVLDPELAVAKAAFDHGFQGAFQAAETHTLVAWPTYAQGLQLLALDFSGDLFIADENTPYFAIGSGVAQADPFLEFLRRDFWPPRGYPSLEVGRRTLCWAMEHAIQTNPGGVGGPIRMVVIGKRKGKYRAVRLTEDEVDEDRELFQEAREAMKKHVAGTVDPANPATDAEAPPMPTPS